MSIDIEKAKELLAVCRKLPPMMRSSYLDGVCGADRELRDRIEAMLRELELQGDRLEEPADGEACVPGSNATQAFVESCRADRNPETTNTERAEYHYLTPSTDPAHFGRLGHYAILGVLGKGGFGTVFKAFDEKLHRQVAIKVLAPELAVGELARKRFVREARAGAALKSEYITAIYNVEDESRPPYLVMELIDGVSLEEYRRSNRPLALKEILRIGMQLAAGLAIAHKQGVIHRDIKPGNILMENDGLRVKITDFGLAHVADHAGISQSNVIVGTPLYMSPEQAEGLPLDQRSDLFSLGSVLYVLCTGRSPFLAGSTMAILKRVCLDSPTPIREINPNLPDWFGAIIAKLHAKKPDDRYSSAREVAELLSARHEEVKNDRARYEYGTSTIEYALGSPIAANASSVPGLHHGGSVADAPGTQKGTLLLFALVAVAVGIVVAVLVLIYWPREGEKAGASNETEHEKKETPVVPVADNGLWVQLFNGKDLTGWKTHPDQREGWHVEKGILTCSVSRDAGHLFTVRDDFKDFHLRLECKINEVGNSGVFFRAPFSLPRGYPDGYEAQVYFGERDNFKTGSLWNLSPSLELPPGVKPDQWFTLEVIAKGSRITIKVNEQITVDRFQDKKFSRGHFALQCYRPETVVQFKKIEILELPPWSEVVEKWGEWIDPKNDCKPEMEKEQLTLHVPGTRLHDMNPCVEFFNNLDAPRVLRSVEGDFVATIRVDPLEAPVPHSSLHNATSFYGAGLLTWINEKSLVRFESARMGEINRDQAIIHTEWFENGERVDIEGAVVSGVPVYLQVERRSDKLLLRWSENGTQWTTLKDVPLTLPRTLAVGPVGINSTNRKFSPVFRDFRIVEKPKNQ